MLAGLALMAVAFSGMARWALPRAPVVYGWLCGVDNFYDGRVGLGFLIRRE